MNGYVHGAVLKPDLLLLPLHWKKRLPKQPDPCLVPKQEAFVQFLEKAREAFAQANAGHEQNTTEEAESLVSVPSVEERREVLTGAAGMIARGRSLFPFG